MNKGNSYREDKGNYLYRDEREKIPYPFPYNTN